MSFTIVDSCSGCGRCIAICEPRAITGATGGLHVIDPGGCVDCGACAIVCGDGAVRDEKGERFAVEGLCAEVPLKAIVRRDACTGCGDCVTSCLFMAIVRVLGAGCATHARVIDSRCTGCGVCQLECDKDAIELVDSKSDEPG